MSLSLAAAVSQNPLLFQLRHHAHSIAQKRRQQLHQQKLQFYTNKFAVWNTNFARLYARRILELAAASAALAKTTTSLKEAVLLQSHAQTPTTPTPPSDWMDWQKRDWTEDLVRGTTPFQRFYMSILRVINLSILAAPFALMAPLSYVSPTVHQTMWNYALYAIEAAGPTAIKFVQWATTRQDLFSPAFCTHFGQLRDATKGHDWKDTAVAMEREFGPDWEQYFAIQETNTNNKNNNNNNNKKTPIGSGCIAQVYRGTLLQATPIHPAGTSIAIKVQHPNIWNKVSVDFYLLGMAANLLEAIPGWNLDYLSIRDTVDQFCNVMLPQLDLRLEAQHLNRFLRNFGSEPQVQFPVPILDSQTVLVETYCHGTPILEFQKASLEVRKELAYLGLSTTLKMIFLHDFIHGDLHPGNILVSRHPKTNQLVMTFLDCGLVIEFGPSQHSTVVQILGAFTRRHGRDAGQLMVDTSSKCQASPLDVELFIKGIEQIIEEDAEQNFVEHIGDYITDICYLACRHKVKLDAAFINAGLAVEIMEGIASSLYPDIQVVSTALPLVMRAEMMHRLGV